MTRVIAALDNSAVARPVLETAVGIASLYRATVDAVHLREDSARTAQAAADAVGVELRSLAGDVLGPLIEAGREDDVVAMVIGTRGRRFGRRSLGHVALELILAVAKPLVLVPPNGQIPFELARVLVPLDGTRATAVAVEHTVELACVAGVEVIVLHVYGEESLPLFSDQPQHELESWAREFLARYSPGGPGVRLEVRVGVPAEHVLRVAEETEASVIALGWSQDLSAGRAAVVRKVLEHAQIPVLLVPIPTRVASGGGPEEPHAGTLGLLIQA